jgi:hypothetical protein
MKIILVLLSFVVIVGADVFTKSNILGVWEVSSLKLHGFTSFGEDFSRKRGRTYTLLFNKKGEVKNKTTSSIYNYEILNGQLKIYKTKTYRNGYTIKDTRNYDLLEISGAYENCYNVKIVKKKLRGYYKKEGYKWCKAQEYPQPITVDKENSFFY